MTELLNRILFGPPAEFPGSGSQSGAGVWNRTRQRVLLIDDEPIVVRVLQRVLAQEHEVMTVSSGAAALLLLAQGERFDVVLCDFGMPSQNGAQVYEELERRFPNLRGRFALMTGSAETDAVAAFAARSGVRCVSKPLRAAELLALVRELAAT
jgi:CheY-like chemotaxis protein